MSPFPFRMAWRETRAGFRHFAAFLVCIALGVAALVAVGSFAATLEGTVAREAKSLMGGDLEIRSARSLDPEAEAALEGLRREGAAVVRVRELAGMARARADRSLLVELKAVGDGYPLYGRIETSPARPLATLLADGGAVVEPALLARLGLALGDTIAIGRARLTLRGIVTKEPDRGAGLVSLGPRVFLAPADLEASALIQVGSRVRYRALARLPEGQAPHVAREALAREIADPTVRIVSFDQAQPRLRRFFARLTSYLGLVGLASLLVGGIGVASAVTMFIRRQRTTIAVLKCLGAGSRRLLATYLIQAQALGVVGSVIGAALGVATLPLLVRLLEGLVPFALETRLDGWTIGRGIAMGSLTTLLCALWPLREIRDIPPSLILRRDVQDEAPGGRRPWPAAITIAVALGSLAVWQAGSLTIGSIFFGAAAVALAVLAGLARGARWLARALPPWRRFAWRQGFAGLRRPGGQVTTMVVALGVGVMLLEAVALLEGSLAGQIDPERRPTAPSFFFVDLQPDQREPFVDTVRRVAAVQPTLTPVVRSRLAAIKGVPITGAMVDGRRARGDEKTWYLTRDYVLTWAAEPPETDEVTRGRWWTAAEAAERPRVSVEKEAAAYLGVTVGDALTFDIQGVRIAAEVMSLRKVDWQSLSTNFFVIVSPGALDGAPLTYLATVRVPAAVEPALQDAVVAALPNVLAVPVRDVLERVAGVVDQIAAAIRVMALLAIAAGLAVMAGTLATSRRERLDESMILRTLGATRGAVARAFAVEYACLGLVAGAGGTALAAVLAWIVLRFVLDTPWILVPGALALGRARTTALAVCVGFLATWRLLGQKPLAVLRRE